MNFYRRENGVIVGGPYNCDQAFPVERLADDHPEVVDFMKPKPPSTKKLSVGELALILVAKGVITQADVDAAKK